MNNQKWDGPELAQSRLRALVGRVDVELETLGAGDQGVRSTALDALSQSWRGLTTALALGEEPALRVCPHCRRRVLQQATRCRDCMKHSDAVEASR